MAPLHLRGDPLWGRPCLAYNVQAYFDEEATRRLECLQAALLAWCPEVIRPTPLPTLHVSVFAIIPVRSSEIDRHALWEKAEQQVRQALADEIESETIVRFEQIAMTPSAVILSTPEQPEPIRRVRKRLNAVVSAIGLPTQTFDRTHVTLARPVADGMIEERAIAAIEALPALTEARLGHFRLVRETVYPSLQIELHA